MLGLSVLWTNRLQGLSLIAGTLVIVSAAVTLIYKNIKKWVQKTAEWIEHSVRHIVKEEIQPLKDEFAEHREINAQSFQSAVEALEEVKEIVKELTPNDGSHLSDVIRDTAKNVEKLLPAKKDR